MYKFAEYTGETVLVKGMDIGYGQAEDKECKVVKVYEYLPDADGNPIPGQEIPAKMWVTGRSEDNPAVWYVIGNELGKQLI